MIEPSTGAYKRTVGMTDYAANGGTDCDNIGGWGMRGPGKTAPISLSPLASQINPSTYAQYDPIGSTKPAHVRDGTSNTLLLGEKLMNASLAGVKDMGDDDAGFVSGWDFDIIRWGCYPPGPDIRDPAMPPHSLQYAAQRGGFGSSHSGQFNAALCDGSVRSISFSVDFQTFQNLSNRKDGNPVSLP